MRRPAILLLMAALAVACAKIQEPPTPPPPVAVVQPPTNFVHRVEWHGQTLAQIAHWYTGKRENWKKLVKPVNPELERCCAALQVGREVMIPRELLVREDPLPRPQVSAQATKPAAKAKPGTAPSQVGEAAAPAASESEGSDAEEASAVTAEAPSAEPIGEAPSAAPTAESASPEASGSVSGKVTFKGEAWDVADGIAYPHDKTIEVALSSKPFDRKEIVKDAKIDTFDVMRHDMTTNASSVTLRIEEDGSLNCVDYSGAGGGGSTCGSAQGSGWKLEKRSRDMIAGTFALTDGDDKIDVRFDMPIMREVKRSGVALPPGGGEPGKAVLAGFRANLSGDYEKIKALRPPEDQKEMDSHPMDENEKKAMLGFIKATTPTGAKILGGTVDGDSALVDFEGKSGGEKVKGTAEVQRIDGKWYLGSVNTAH